MSEHCSPKFSAAEVIQRGRTDGYWVRAFQFSAEDEMRGVLVSGLNSGKVEFLDNPLATKHSGGPKEWKAYLVAPDPEHKDPNFPKHQDPKHQDLKEQNFHTPVAVIGMDIRKNGLLDVVICHGYGATMIDSCDPGGFIYWYENPGRGRLKENKPWKRHYIGQWPVMHRLETGHFTQRSFSELIAAPVIHGPKDKTTPIPILRFQIPSDPMTAKEWPRDVVDDQNFTVIHELAAKRLDGQSGLDSLLVSSREGVTRLYYDDGRWKKELIGRGEPKREDQKDDSTTPGSGDHWGTGSADIGRVGSDRYAYVATIDPFHSTKVCVYTKHDDPHSPRVEVEAPCSRYLRNTDAAEALGRWSWSLCDMH
ncbi:hypothetical protein QC762_608080 [Podospora pseudocomata]|uniref:Aldos-2-ulose dehydratase beta-propeller domain-containing protein n=1 Tax=Podospora pseudocomata TaxID=2093779 RepID=A0ABR0GDS6_9PEZI|nr:hypothetical protein QC762_608080 [Podospora pseudocomata]